MFSKLHTPFFAALLLSGAPGIAQVITTYAGNDALFTAIGQPATTVQIAQPAGLAIDQSGNIYIAALGQSMVLKVASNGTISVAAGDGLARYSGDGGPAVAASLASLVNQFPNGLAFDGAGNLYIADQANNVIRRVDTNGNITTVAGTGSNGFSGDGGPATKAMLFQPTGVAVDSAGNLYIADTQNDRIRMVTASGTISTIAGNGNAGFSGDGGPAISAVLHQPTGIALDGAGNIYIADTNSSVVRKIASNGIITTVAGMGTKFGYSGDGGPATSALLNQASDIKIDASGNLYIADYGNQRIRRVTPTGIISTIAGTGQIGFAGDSGPAMSALFSGPTALAIDSTGALIVADQGNNRVRRIVPGGAINTIAGQTLSIGDGASSTLGRLTSPANTAVDASMNLYIADSGENRIRKVAPSGTITTFAGTGAAAESGDGGPASAAAVRTPYGVAVDAAGNVYIADSANELIRKVSAATGNISVLAGNGGCCYAGPGTGGDGGPAISATLFYPRGVGVDGSGNVYMIDEIVGPTGTGQGTCVRRVTADGKINIYAGGALAGFSGDGGPATQAVFGNAINIAVASNGTLYIADSNNNRVRRVDPVTQIITTIAGNGQSANSGDGGQATSAGLSFPQSVAVDSSGNIYIGGAGYVRKVNTSGVISTYAGRGYGFSGDNGPATAAYLTSIDGLSVDSAGNLYLTDAQNNRIRIVQPATASLGVTPASLAFTAAGTQTFAVTATGGSLSWAAAASTVTGGTWLSVAPSTGTSVAGQAGATVNVTVNPTALSPGVYYGQIQVTSSAAGNPVQLVTVSLTLGAGGTAPPQVAPGGILSTASYSLQTPVAPGTLVSIFGSNLTAAGQVYQAAYPLPTQMGGVTVTIGGELVPLDVVTPGQINAILPFDLPVNTTLPLIVTYNNAVSVPEPVTVVASEPGIFTSSENGQGLGIVVLVHPSGAEVIAGPGNPASAGDVLVIYCTGLGDVNPRGVAGSPAPIFPLSQAIDPVTVTLGGINVPVSFAGPTPNFAGLYQVNATVPTGITASPAAPLILTQSGRSSPVSVTIPVQ